MRDSPACFFCFLFPLKATTWLPTASKSVYFLFGTSCSSRFNNPKPRYQFSSAPQFKDGEQQPEAIPPRNSLRYTATILPENHLILGFGELFLGLQRRRSDHHGRFFGIPNCGMHLRLIVNEWGNHPNTPSFTQIRGRQVTKTSTNTYTADSPTSMRVVLTRPLKIRSSRRSAERSWTGRRSMTAIGPGPVLRELVGRN